MSYYIIFTDGVSVVYLGFRNIYILCAGGDYLSFLGGGALVCMSVSV